MNKYKRNDNFIIQQPFRMKPDLILNCLSIDNSFDHDQNQKQSQIARNRSEQTLKLKCQANTNNNNCHSESSHSSIDIINNMNYINGKYFNDIPNILKYFQYFTDEKNLIYRLNNATSREECLKTLTIMWKKSKFCDVIFMINEKEYLAHKAVLVYHSQKYRYFKL
jgi:hypothetical protein